LFETVKTLNKTWKKTIHEVYFSIKKPCTSPGPRTRAFNFSLGEWGGQRVVLPNDLNKKKIGVLSTLINDTSFICHQILATAVAVKIRFNFLKTRFIYLKTRLYVIKFNVLLYVCICTYYFVFQTDRLSSIVFKLQPKILFNQFVLHLQKSRQF
jgi:hypothetical protein